MRIEKVNNIYFDEEEFNEFLDSNETIKYGIFHNDILIGGIFVIDLEVGYYMSKNYRNKGYMYEALKMFINKDYTFTVSINNYKSNNLLKKLGILPYKMDEKYIYYKKA